MFSTEHLRLMDAGMSNNLPIYPLLRPGRDVDILIVFDASADIKSENWLAVADDYARQRGIVGWPHGVGWPKPEPPQTSPAQELAATQATTAQEAAGKIATARDQQRAQANRTPTTPVPPDLGYCTIWIGHTSPLPSSSSDPPPQGTRLPPPASTSPSASASPHPQSSGLTLIYFPLLPNPAAPGVDPNTSDYLSTWNFVYTATQIEQVVGLARANFEAGKEQTHRCVRAVWEGKKRRRWERERREGRERWVGRWREGGDLFL